MGFWELQFLVVVVRKWLFQPHFLGPSSSLYHHRRRCLLLRQLGCSAIRVGSEGCQFKRVCSIRGSGVKLQHLMFWIRVRVLAMWLRLQALLLLNSSRPQLLTVRISFVRVLFSLIWLLWEFGFFWAEGVRETAFLLLNSSGHVVVVWFLFAVYCVLFISLFLQYNCWWISLFNVNSGDMIL